jgi:hypothetical protein
MAVNTVWHVTYGFIDSNKKATHDSQQNVLVLAATNDENTLRTVLVNAGIVRPGATIAILGSHAIQGGATNVLS